MPLGAWCVDVQESGLDARIEMRTLLLATATGLTAIFLLPQIIRVTRSGDRSGLSATWATFGLITNGVWILYLASLGMWGAATAPALAVVAYGSMLTVLTRALCGEGWVWAGALYVGLLATVGSLAGIEGIGLLLILTPLIQLTPAIVAAYRERCPTGIAPVTWGLSAAEAGLWGWYGWLVRDPTLLGYGIVTGIGSMLVLNRWLTTRPRMRAAIAGNA
jgi:hypothetical protein